MMVYVSDALIHNYKLASLSFALAGSYNGMVEMEFRLTSPSIACFVDITGKAVAEDVEGGEVFLFSVTGPPLSSGSELHIRTMLRELVNQLNKEMRKGGEESIHDSNEW